MDRSLRKEKSARWGGVGCGGAGGGGGGWTGGGGGAWGIIPVKIAAGKGGGKRGRDVGGVGVGAIICRCQVEESTGRGVVGGGKKFGQGEGGSRGVNKKQWGARGGEGVKWQKKKGRDDRERGWEWPQSGTRNRGGDGIAREGVGGWAGRRAGVA